MRHESRVNFLFPTFLVVITFSHFAFLSYSNPFYKPKQPPVINNVRTYKLSIKGDSTKWMVLVQKIITQAVVQLKYAEKNNFTGTVLYTDTTAFLRYSAAIALKNVNDDLALLGLGIKVFDAYRPYSVTKKMWNLVHDERYAANPLKGSGHNRGAAVDVTIVKKSSNEELEMPTPFDDFTEKAHHNYMSLPKQVLENRSLLRNVMVKNGFVALETEWWHYSLPKASERYELLDLSFEQLKQLTSEK